MNTKTCQVTKRPTFLDYLIECQNHQTKASITPFFINTTPTHCPFCGEKLEIVEIEKGKP